MKVIVLGGAGDVGSRAAEEIALGGNNDVEVVTIADRNEAAAHKVKVRIEQRAALSLGAGRRAPEIRVAVVDAFHHAGLVAAIKGHTLAASALGPFHLFEVRCARASIEAGVDYCSVCDDWNAAADVIDLLHDVAKERGVVCVSGFGATPGASNVAVAWMASTMDLATDVEISCFQPLNAGGGEAVLRHMLFVMSGTLPVWRDGRKQLVRACGETYRVAFPLFGSVTLWPMGHAEPVTMHRFITSLRNVSYRMGFGFGSRLLVWPAWLGFFKFRFFVWLTVWFFGLLDVILKRFPKGRGALRVDVYGMRNGQRCHELVCGVGEMREVTGVSLAVGALLLGRKQSIPHAAGVGGVFAPEGAMKPTMFLREIIRKGFVAYRDVEMRTQLTEEDLVDV